MKLLNKTISILLSSVVLISSLTSCTSKKNEEPSKIQTESTSQSQSSDKKIYKIGITQIIDHDSLDAARKGFIDELKALGYEDGKNIEIDYQNSQGAQANCQTIASQFVGDKKDLVLAISTPSAQSIANATKDIPILITAVTDPVGAKLVKSNDKPQTNVSGTSDMAPVKQQIELVKELMPEIKTLGLLYSSSEDNSISQIEIAKKTCEELGIAYKEATVANINDIPQVVTDLVNKVDAIYSPTDNVIASSMPNVLSISNTAKIPTFTGWAAEGDKGGMAALAIDYYELGKITAQQAVDILEGKVKVSEMPIKHQENCSVYINRENAELLGITIPDKYND